MANVSKEEEIKNQVVLFNLQHAFFISKNPFVILITVIMVLSSVSRLITNLIEFLAIMKQKALRQTKEYLMMAILSWLDAIAGLHHACFFLFHYGTANTRLLCLLTVRNISHLVGSHSAAFMLMLISIDRLVGVSVPLWYYGQTVSFVYKLLAFLIGFQVIIDSYELYFVYNWPDQIVPFCLTSHTFLHGFHVVGVLLKLWQLCSCVIYVWVLVMQKRYLRKTVMPKQSCSSSKEWSEYRARSRSVTVTFGISALITFSMAVIPLTGLHVLRIVNPSLQVAAWIALVPYDWSTIVNLFLYMKRHKEVRRAVKALFKRETLPEKLENWPENVVGSSPGQFVHVSQKLARKRNHSPVNEEPLEDIE